MSSWGTRTRTPNNSTRNCCVANYTIPHRGEPVDDKSTNGSRVLAREAQPVIDSSRLNPTIRPTATPAASSSSLDHAAVPLTGLVRVGDT